MENKDIIDLLFEKKEEENNFNMSDSALKQYRSRVYETSNKLYEYIDMNFSNEVKENLKNLISDRNNAMSDSYYREFQLFYRNGILDGLYLKLLNPNNN